MNRDERLKQIHLNYKAFEKMSFDPADKGRSALLCDGELIKIFDTRMAAHELGTKLFPDSRYSIQEILPDPIYFGWSSHALSKRHP